MYRRQMERLPKNESREKQKEYMARVKQLIDESGPKDRAPVVTERISRLHQEYFKTLFSFETLKKQYNACMMQKEPEIRKKIEDSDDPLRTALLYARAGNYIDFGAMGKVEDEKLEALLQRVSEESLDESEYEAFQRKLKTATSLAYLTDNCGEIVMDKLLLEQILKSYPQCEVNVIVRGTAVLNDATMEDAKMTGVDSLVNVYGNGTGIAGTSLKHIRPEVRTLIETSDVIISKGQGNFETLYGCGLPVFYLFLCKCSWFVKRFGLPFYEGVMIQEENLRNICSSF